MSANISQKGNDHYVSLKSVSLGANNTNPTVPASTTPLTNSTGKKAVVYVSGGTVTDVTVAGAATGLTKGQFTVLNGQTIAVTYTVAPSWHWFT